MWRFIAPETKTVHIAFLEANFEGKDGIVIHNGWDSGSSVGTISDEIPPNAQGYSSQTNVLSMEFESKPSNPSRKRSKGFRGIFKIMSSKGKI